MQNQLSLCYSSGGGGHYVETGEVVVPRSGVVTLFNSSKRLYPVLILGFFCVKNLAFTDAPDILDLLACLKELTAVFSCPANQVVKVGVILSDSCAVQRVLNSLSCLGCA
jgi:hypothetical protein